MKTLLSLSLALTFASLAGAANIPSGLTGLWRFQNTTNLGAATVGKDLMFSNSVYGVQYLGPWTDIGGEGWLTRHSDGYIFQERAWDYLAVDPGFAPNGGGVYVNEYTVAIDYKGDPGMNSVFQTSRNGNATDGDLWINGTTHTSATIGVDDAGFSTLTFDASKWHRIVWSVDNGNFFRVYVDGVLFLDGTAQAVDGRLSVYPDRLNLFADDSWQDSWGMVGTIVTWDHALTTDEVAGMGGWIGDAASPTPLVYSNTPEVVSVTPANGETNVAPAFAYQANILDPVQIVNRDAFQLLFDGAPVTPVVTGPAASVSVNFSGGGLLQSGSTHKYTLIGEAGGTAFTNEVTFQVQNYTTYEWAFTNADLSAALGDGVLTNAAGGSSAFGTTDGATVPHINGNPAKYLHVPAFTLDTDGYWLIFNDSGPNVGANPNINRYTLILDMLVPGPTPWPDWVVPFFNTDPYNLDSDADFYLTGDGEIGIGGGNYSAANTVSPNLWCRIVFVADLKANTLSYYVNGANVKSRTADGLDGRWSLFSNQQVGPSPLYPANLLLFNEPSATLTHELYLSSVAFTDRALSGDEVAALGGPNATGIFVSNLAPPGLTIQTTAGGARISWPANYIGYRLEQTESLAAPQWMPVAGITNNAANLVTESATRFFRLSQ